FLDENDNLIKIIYNKSEGRRKPRDNDQSKIGVWTKTVINNIIDKYVCSKRVMINKQCVLSRDETITDKANEIREENPNITYSDLAREINKMGLYNYVIKPKNISELIKPIEFQQP